MTEDQSQILECSYFLLINFQILHRGPLQDAHEFKAD